MQPATGATGSASLVAALAAAVAGLTATAPASALFNDRVEIWAAENVTHDTNVFRLSDKLDPSTVGASQRGDSIYTTHLGITAGLPVSQQRFEAAYTWYRSNYRSFKDLDFTGHTARAAWNWSYDHRLTGVASYTESEGLSSFSNIQARDKDLVTSRHAQLTAQWMATPRWKANAGLGAVQAEHSSVLRRINDIEAESAEAGLSYVTPRENLIGGSARFEHGRAPHGTTFASNPFFGRPFENEYDQWAVGATTSWNLTGHSRFDGRLEWVRRNYKELTARNYDGPAFRAIYTWTPTAKLKVSAGATRDIGPAEDIQTSFVLVTGAYIRPLWAVTDKVTLQGNFEYNVWDYRGDPITGQDFTHRQRLIGASVQWKPYERVFLQAGFNREVRTSTLRFGDYDVDVAFVEGRVGF